MLSRIWTCDNWQVWCTIWLVFLDEVLWWRCLSNLFPSSISRLTIRLDLGTDSDRDGWCIAVSKIDKTQSALPCYALNDRRWIWRKILKKERFISVEIITLYKNKEYIKLKKKLACFLPKYFDAMTNTCMCNLQNANLDHFRPIWRSRFDHNFINEVELHIIVLLCKTQIWTIFSRSDVWSQFYIALKAKAKV